MDLRIRSPVISLPLHPSPAEINEWSAVSFSTADLTPPLLERRLISNSGIETNEAGLPSSSERHQQRYTRQCLR